LIDLSHPAFIADGIFAITGPTGAGKSTLLDAMCLALYGRTPRLKNISKSTNEIMSRQTGECFAEVIFETQAGQFRCHWSQHRARKKAEGELQSPKHEIADAISGKIIEAKIRGVAQQIEKATGMDFDRFTRSMLLAQGGFAAFLQADPDQRAPILEQITGTEIYSNISIKVHQRRSEETTALALLNAELAGMQLLSIEQQQQLAADLAEKTKNNDVLADQLQHKNIAISWLDGIINNEAELLILNEQQQQLSIRQTAFQPQRDKLEQAKQALEISADYAGITLMRSEQLSSQQNLNNSQQLLPEIGMQCTKHSDSFNSAHHLVESTKKEQKQTQIVLKNVRELDFKIVDKQKIIQSTQDTRRQITQQLMGLNEQQLQQNQQGEQQKTELIKVTELLANNDIDQGLVAQLASIENQFQLLKERSNLQQQKVNEQTQAEQKKNETADDWQTQANIFEQHNDQFEGFNKAFRQHQDELEKCLEHRSINEWRQQLTSLTERHIQLEKSQISVQLLTKLNYDLNKLTQQEITLKTDVVILDEKITDQTSHNESLEREIKLLETQQLLYKTIESYENARQHLVDNKPCPLCGSNDHPYAQGNMPLIDHTNNSLSSAKSTIKLNLEKLAQLRITLAENHKDQIHISQQQIDKVSNVNQQESLLKGYKSLLLVEGELTETLLQQWLDDNKNRLIQASTIVDDVEKRQHQLSLDRQDLDKKTAQLTEFEKNIQTLNLTKIMAKKTAERLTIEADAATRHLLLAQKTSLTELSIYGIEHLEMGSLDQLLLKLTQRRDLWQQWQQEKIRLEPLIANLTSTIKHGIEKIADTESELTRQQQTLTVLKFDSEQLVQQRIMLFTNKNPDLVETTLINNVEQAEKNLDISRHLFKDTETALNKLQHDIETLSKVIDRRTEQLSKAEIAFDQQLLKLGFADDIAYQAARLNDIERQALERQDQLLKSEFSALMARLNDKTRYLTSERTKKVTEQPLDLLKTQQQQLISSLNVMKEEIGAIRQKLADNEQIRLKQQSRIEAIEAQQRECVRWNTLHELIGSADGKKYRNFAQGLTFEMMIGHANRQLHKMTDRYLLTRDEEQALELNVVDNYQAGEIRSTKNLSGGESFIVSLALALGLSQMASKNVRVDSLFLDEGFGTLDEEALDTALETLSGLQQEGKLIGVISHVQVLKERISTQIQISPTSGGRSTMSGPGIIGPDV
jgi:exonuclease SbcC